GRGAQSGRASAARSRSRRSGARPGTAPMVRGPGRGGRGSDEHARERIRRCVTERAQELTTAFGGNGPMKRQAAPGTGPLKPALTKSIIDLREVPGPKISTTPIFFNS